MGVALSLIVVVGVLTWLYWGTHLGDNPKFAAYISVLGLVGVLVLALTYIRTASTQAQAQLERENQLANRHWIQNERIFLRSGPELERLYGQIYSQNPCCSPTLRSNDPVTPAEAHMSQILFQTMENVRAVVETQNGGWKKPENAGWLAAFRSWFRSPILREQWEVSKQYYDPGTRRLVDTLLVT